MVNSNLSNEVNYEFVIQFSGIDMPGLLRAFTSPLKEKGYNVSNISLASGHQRHNTFITCNLHQSSMNKAEHGVNRWKDRWELWKALSDEVGKCQKDHFAKEKIEPTLDPVIEITARDRSNRTNVEDWSFNLHVIFKVQSTPGHLGKISESLSESYSVTQTFDWPDEAGVQTVYMQNQYLQPPQENDEHKLSRVSREFLELARNGDMNKMSEKFSELRKEFEETLSQTDDSGKPKFKAEVERIYVKFDNIDSGLVGNLKKGIDDCKGQVYDGTLWDKKNRNHKKPEVNQIDNLVQQIEGLKDKNLNPILLQRVSNAIEALKKDSETFKKL